MHVIRARLIRGGGPRDSGGVAVPIEDLLWAHAVPAIGLEHIRARPTQGGLDVYLFIDAPDEPRALAQVRDLLIRAGGAITTQGYAAPAASD
ncbi:hypothetical protein [Streptomyces sp. NPDC048361]|uniref:hypothetical protein n=1 Tax=Streptomyces sp. NPDC048361 TaxID=3154720 RepID=UPI003441658E